MSRARRPAAVLETSSLGSLNMPVPRSHLVPAPGLLYWRDRRMLTQDDLSAKSGVARSNIARLEAGGVTRFSTLRKLAAALDIEPEALRQPPEQP